jgi:DNA polymerase-3 subunit chi
VAKPCVIFVELNIQNKFRYACDIIEKFYDNGLSVIVYTDDKKKADTLDRQLWVWKQETFIPHVFKENLISDSEEPVVVTNNADLGIESDALILFDPLPEQKLGQFNYIIDFAEVYDKTRVIHSRERFKKMRDSELFEMNFFKLGEFLSKYKFN